jgi:hypothetical protein
MFFMSNSNLWLEHADRGDWDVSGLEVLIMLEGNIAGVPVVVGRTVGFLEAGELLSHLHLTLHHSAEVPSGEDAVLRNHVVLWVWLEVIQVLEAGCIRVTEEEWQECIAVINSVKLFAFQELLQVMLNNWCLMDGSGLCPGSVDTNAITESEDVLEALVLKSVGVHVNYSLAGCNAWLEKLFVGLAGRVDNSWEEVFLKNCSGINAAEGCDLLTLRCGMHLDHLLSKEDFDSTFPALLESNFVGIREFEDLLVGGPVLNACILSSNALKLVLTQEVFVVEGIEITALTLVGELGWIANHISVGVVPSVIVVVVNTFFGVDSVDKDVALGIVLELWETLDVLSTVMEAWGEDKWFVGVLAAVGKAEFVLLGQELCHLGEGVHAWPGFNLSGNSGTLKLKIGEMAVRNTEVRLGKDVTRAIRDNCHLIINAIALKELHDGSCVHATNEYNVKVGLSGWHCRFLGATAREVSLVHANESRWSSLLSEELRCALSKHILS